LKAIKEVKALDAVKVQVGKDLYFLKK